MTSEWQHMSNQNSIVELMMVHHVKNSITVPSLTELGTTLPLVLMCYPEDAEAIKSLMCQAMRAEGPNVMRDVRLNDN